MRSELSDANLYESPHYSQTSYARGWKQELKGHNAVFEIMLTTDGHLYFLPVANSIGAAVARNVGRQFGILGAVAGSLASSALRNKAEKDGKAANDALTLAERMAKSPKQGRKIPSMVIDRLFAGEKGFGFGKERNGIYFRPGVPKVPAPRGLGMMWIPEEDLDWNAAMNGWCEAAGVRCEGFSIGELRDPVWLEGPLVGEVAGSAADALAEMAALDLVTQRDELSVESMVEAAAESSGRSVDSSSGSNPMALVSVGLGVVAGIIIFLGFIFGLVVPGMGGLGSCLTLPMSLAAIVMGLVAYTKASKDPFEKGKTPAIVGTGLGVMMLGGSFIVPFISSLIARVIHSF